MKKFDFALERVREWRQEQVGLEVTQLEMLYAAARKIGERRVELDRDQERNETAVLRADSVDGMSLRALDEYRKYARYHRSILDRERAESDGLIAAQRERLLLAQRNAKLLEKLKQRQFAVWQAQFDRALEEQASESFLAQWKPDRY